MTGETPGVEYQELNVSSVINAVLAKMARGHFAPFLEHEDIMGLRDRLRSITAASKTPKIPATFTLVITKFDDDEPTTIEAWLALEYSFLLADTEGEEDKCGLTGLYDSNDSEHAEYLELLRDCGPDSIYDMGWDDVNWAYGYNLVTQQGVSEDPETGRLQFTTLSHSN